MKSNVFHILIGLMGNIFSDDFGCSSKLLFEKKYFDEIIYLQLILPIIDGHCFVNKYKIIGFVSIIVDIVVI